MSLLAHGVGVRGDLPLPLWQFAWGAGIVLVAVFLGLGFGWNRSRLPRAAEGRDLGARAAMALDVVAVPARLASLALFVLAVASGIAGATTGGQSLGPTTVYVSFWVGLQAVSALLGNVWRTLNPFETLVGAWEWLRSHIGGRPRGQPRAGNGTEPPFGYWPAVLTISVFLALELGYHDGASPAVIGWGMLAYSVVMLGGVAVWGRQWLRRADGFAVLFWLLSLISPFTRDDGGALRLRAPLAGLTTMPLRTDLLALLLVVLGGTSFDGFSASTVWPDLAGRHTGWSATVVNTAGLVIVVGVAVLIYTLASQAVAARTGRTPDEVGRTFAHSLVPIVLGYSLAHYFSLVVFEGQRFVQLLSDPFARGADWFGTADWSVNFLLVSTSAIAWVQFGAIVAGHVLAVIVAHDRALESAPTNQAARSQLPMLAAMIVYSVGGLWILQSA